MYDYDKTARQLEREALLYDYDDINLSTESFGDLSNLYLVQKNIPGTDFRDKILDGATLLHCNLADSDFSGSSLKGINLRGSVMAGVVVDREQLEDVAKGLGMIIKEKNNGNNSERKP